MEFCFNRFKKHSYNKNKLNSIPEKRKKITTIFILIHC